jgi:hypothetical protein
VRVVVPEGLHRTSAEHCTHSIGATVRTDSVAAVAEVADTIVAVAAGTAQAATYEPEASLGRLCLLGLKFHS